MSGPETPRAAELKRRFVETAEIVNDYIGSCDCVGPPEGLNLLMSLVVFQTRVQLETLEVLELINSQIKNDVFDLQEQIDDLDDRVEGKEDR